MGKDHKNHRRGKGKDKPRKTQKDAKQLSDCERGEPPSPTLRSTGEFGDASARPPLAAPADLTALVPSAPVPAAMPMRGKLAAPPASVSPESGIAQDYVANKKWLIPVTLIFGGVIVAAAIGYLTDFLGWTDLFRKWRILGHRAGSPTLGIVLSAACLLGGFVFGLAHVIKHSAYWKAVAELSGIALVGGGLVLYAAIELNRTEAVQANPPVSELIPQQVYIPDASDVEHLGREKNVIRARPGETKDHPILLWNKKQSEWIGRQLCRETGADDSRAVRTATACVSIPSVGPGGHVPIILEVTAPIMPGVYRARWKMVSEDGAIVYPDAPSVVVEVRVQ